VQGAEAGPAAAGANPNPFFRPVAVGQPIIAPAAVLSEVKLSRLQPVDFATQAGGCYEIKASP